MDMTPIMYAGSMTVMGAKENASILIIRTAFKRPMSWRAGRELVIRKAYRIKDRKRHWFYEWISIEKA